jgi:HSP20 family protein
MKEATEQRGKEQQGAAAGSSSSPPSGASGQGQRGGEANQTTGKQHTQPPSGTNSEGKQQQSQARGMTANGGSQRLPQQSQRGMAPRGWFESSSWMDNPFRMMRRFSEEMDRLFDDIWSGRGVPRGRSGGRESQMGWSPQVEMYEKDNQLVICTDLPGLKQEDIQLEVSDDMLTIQGERRNEFEDTQEGYYRSERSYGSFSRVIPLPEGIDTEQAKASFESGVLKVMFPLPEQQRQRKRRIEVEGGSTQQGGASGQGGSSSSSSRTA